jgi:hypothetical protein
MERQTTSAADGLQAAVDTLVHTDLGSLSATEITGLLAAVETQRRRLEAVDQRLIAEVSERGLAGEYARTSTADLLIHLLRITPREAKARVERAQDLGPRRAMIGERLAPLFPATAQAIQVGEISAGHADVITGALERVSRLVAPDAVPTAEALLLTAARHQHPKDLARTAALLLARLDPDGLEPIEDELERRRGFSLTKLPDGSAVPRGRWTPELVALWESILDALAAPNPSDDVPDQRSVAQRRHDGMAEAANRLLASDSLPPAGGSPVTVLAVTTMTELQTGAGIAVTGHGGQLSISRLLEMAADARIIPVVCNDTGGVLAYGRGRRLASKDQRLALAARDRGCCFPGCNRPAAWTEVHHTRAWIDRGETNIDEMCLLCRFHHRYFAKFGWQPVMIDGVPYWKPPAWLDPERKPRRNTAQHLPHVEFGRPAA